MFNKLKEKLSGFTKSLGKQIDEKAVPVEPVQEEVAEIPFVSPSETEQQPLVDTASEITIDEVEPQKAFVSDQNLDTKASRSQEQKKTGLISKAKALVFEREFILDEKDLEEPLWDLQIALLESDIALTVAEAITEAVRSELVGSRRKIGKDTTDIVEQALRNALYDVMSANIFDLDDYVRNARKPVHIVFVGINGTGKTTSIAKAAKRFKDMGYSVVLAAGDTFRAGAIDQLQIHGDRVGVKVIRHQEGGDPAAVVYDAMQYAKAHKADIVLSDTAGRMHTNLNLMEQLKKVCRVSAPDLIIFVDEAVAGNDAVERAAQFNEAVPINGSILTKTDADAKGGAAISIAYITGKPILFLGMGQGYDDLKKFDPKWFVDQIFE
ncbi:MAG: Signal recognition particle 54 kDa protein [Methanomethylovorans sp. PtaU1.Bin093]|jgi:fused signal recognition particle receptor|uniref:signal recognition particle-docking protein FtsY n=1 Tax=Methanomethylovorans sp. PtaU1.Bin093 TaxID=1811679 RepID=UPI0009D0493B|nr:signal recognition particle-docking protein FtsY [Methanomethylovorans sp. PtaU1.Bin093]OPY22140.1 MAG: Signal recognition particle 54 kDa protein [Methanomethylovorans sp. PtaU1.Bin093]